MARKKRPELGDPEPRPKGGRSLRDYADALRPRVPEPGLVVLTESGLQFSVHSGPDAEAKAMRAAERIGGTVHPYTPVVSSYWDASELGARYDH